MAPPLFASSPHASLLLLLSPSPAAPARLHYTLRSRLPVRVASRRRGRRLEGGIPDEWGERSQPVPVPEPPSQPDLPIDDDEWGRTAASSASASASASGNSRPVVADEWGEPGEPEAEAPSPADPPINDDEWGRASASASASGNSRPVVADEWGEPGEPEAEAPSPADPPINDDEWGGDPTPPVGEGAPEDDKEERREELKRCLVDTVYGSDLGLRASAEVRGEVVELVTQLEAANPTPAPVQAPELLDGNWILVYTAYSELLPILLAGATPFSKVQKIYQEIDTKSMTIVNASTISTPFASFSFSATASFDVQSPSRIEVQFKEGSFQPPEISSSVDLPAQIDIFGQKISLGPVQQALNPLQQAFSSIAGSISGQPPLKVPIPGNNRARSWLLTTYLDKDFRISRGDGGLFILAKQGSPLLDEL